MLLACRAYDALTAQAHLLASCSRAAASHVLSACSPKRQRKLSFKICARGRHGVGDGELLLRVPKIFRLEIALFN